MVQRERGKGGGRGLTGGFYSMTSSDMKLLSFGFELRMEPTNGTEGKKQRRGWGQTGGFYSMTSSDMKLLAPKIQQEK